jgi:hypothetical protein
MMANIRAAFANNPALCSGDPVPCYYQGPGATAHPTVTLGAAGLAPDGLTPNTALLTSLTPGIAGNYGLAWTYLPGTLSLNQNAVPWPVGTARLVGGIDGLDSYGAGTAASPNTIFVGAGYTLDQIQNNTVAAINDSGCEPGDVPACTAQYNVAAAHPTVDAGAFTLTDYSLIQAKNTGAAGNLITVNTAPPAPFAAWSSAVGLGVATPTVADNFYTPASYAAPLGNATYVVAAFLSGGVDGGIGSYLQHDQMIDRMWGNDGVDQYYSCDPTLLRDPVTNALLGFVNQDEAHAGGGLVQDTTYGIAVINHFAPADFANAPNNVFCTSYTS